MIPPPAFKREANAPQASLSTLQKVVRYAEKDDLLLYMTAAFGVLMPGLMYFFYRYIHGRYQQKIRVQKLRKKQSEKRRTVTIFYASDIPATKEIAYELAENLQFDPLVAKLGAQEMDKLRHSKAAHIFVLSHDTKQEEAGSSRLAEFVDWLDELKYERREKNYLRDTRFLILFVQTEKHPSEQESQIVPFEKRLCSLGSAPFDQTQTVDANKEGFHQLCAHLNDLLRRFNYGEFDDPEFVEDESQECSEDEGSD